MRCHVTRRWALIATTALIVLSAGVAILLNARAQAAAPDASGASSSGTDAAIQRRDEGLLLRRQQIEQAERQIRQDRSNMLQLMFERVKSIKRRRGLTPKQAQAFDDAYAAELARINQAEQQLEVARQELAAQEREARTGVAPQEQRAPTDLTIRRLRAASRQLGAPKGTPQRSLSAAESKADILARLEALERRVAALERAAEK